MGELYRIQKHLDMPCPASTGDIYGLLNGFESVLEEQLPDIVTDAELRSVSDTLNVYFQDREKIKTFTGYYDIEDELNLKKIDRGKAIRILRYFWANGNFSELIEKMDSDQSPIECRGFELDDSEK